MKSIESVNDNKREKSILNILNLKVGFKTSNGVVHAVDRVSFSLNSGETLCLVGESGCGKSVTSLAIMRLLPKKNVIISADHILFEGANLLAKSEKEMQELRGDRIAMIFQDPMTSLNPVLKVGQQITEVLRRHRHCDVGFARKKTLEVLDLVKIPESRHCFNVYPHELSGGMQQRVMIAMALVCDPKVLIADEPTTALDVTIQAQILHLIDELKRDIGAAILLITHDMGVVAEIADRVAVMYAGRLVEEAPVCELFESTQHGYTHGLMQSMPRFGRSGQHQMLKEIPGTVPALIESIAGCQFASRCQFTKKICHQRSPELVEICPSHYSACFEHTTVEEASRIRVNGESQ